MLKKYNKEYEKYRAIYYEKNTLAKSYIYSFIISIIITLPLFIIAFNLMSLHYEMVFNYSFTLASCLLFIYLLLFFKDKIFEEYVTDAKKVNLAYLRLIDFLIVSVIAILLFIFMIILF